jgi:hypothetical protein
MLLRAVTLPLAYGGALDDTSALLGCTYERATGRYVAINVPPHADTYAVYQVLKRAKGRVNGS